MISEFWAVGLMKRWENLDILPPGWPEGMPSPFGIAPAGAGESIGFLPVFSTEAAAREFARHEGGTYAVIRMRSVEDEVDGADSAAADTMAAEPPPSSMEGAQ